MCHEPTTAFESVIYIETEVPFGWFIRRVHATASNLFVAILFLHFLSTLFMGAYKKPRELQWFTGFGLYFIVLATGLSGYLLPWSQLSYWATTVATNTVDSIPWLGEAMVLWLRGAERVSQITLARFYTLHVFIVPVLLIFLIALHLFFMRRTGISSPPHPSGEEEEQKKMPFYPHFITEDLKAIYVVLAILFFLAFFFPQLSIPEEAMVPADPFETPLHIKPEWYFLSNYQILKLIPNKLLGVFVQILVAIIVLFLPFIDRGTARHPSKRPLAITLAIIGVILYLGLTIMGWVS